MADRVFKFFCSLRLTVVLLTLSMLLVFFGTMAQVDLGLYEAQARYFRSFFVDWRPKGARWQIPVYPGGYLLGGLLLTNLIAAHIKRFKLKWNKAGIFLIHAGIILLLLGQLSTDLLSNESRLHLTRNQTLNYSESDRDDEIAFINATNPNYDEVLAIPCTLLKDNGEINDPRLPFTVRVKHYFPNSARVVTPGPDTPLLANQGLGTQVTVRPAEIVTDTDHRNAPSAVIELTAGGTDLGSWLVSDWYKDQEVRFGTNTFKLAMRPIRHYTPYSIQLLKFSYDKYLGTDTAKNYSSRVRLVNPETKEDREVLIYMNNPLRYAGRTYYQASTDENDPTATVLQVVKNPGWLTPYLACLLVGGGMLWQFLGHLVRFLRKSKLGVQPVPARTAAAAPATVRRRTR